MSTARFDPAAYKRTTREQWQSAAAWREIEDELSKFESSQGFDAACELIVSVGIAA